MSVLLDTHIYLWWLHDSPRLSNLARNLIHDADKVHVSSASIWEASIKSGLGKLRVDVEKMASQIELNGFIELPVHSVHAVRVRTLPDLHRDPFDRILVAQAICEPLLLLTADHHLAAYSSLIRAV